MKKFILITLLTTLLFTNVNCGGGVESSNTSGKTMVSINIGKAGSTASTGERLSKSIPSHIASIRFTITAPDIVTIIRIVPVAGRESISETFEIPNGKNRNFLIEALDVSGNVLYRKTTFVNLDEIRENVRYLLKHSSEKISELCRNSELSIRYYNLIQLINKSFPH